MISPVTKEIGGFAVRFRPLPATSAFTLAKRVGALVLPVLKTLDLSNLSADVDLNVLIDTAAAILSDTTDERAVGIVVDSLIGLTITPPGGTPVEITDRSTVDSVFCGELEAMYQIVFEAWKYNKLAPFKLAARFGLQTKVTDSSSEAAGTETKRGPRLAMSGVSPMK
jgi:hypothetical protein